MTEVNRRIILAARPEGFLVFDHATQFPEAQRQIAQWMEEGKIKYHETITNGLENAPRAFIGLFSGESARPD